MTLSTTARPARFHTTASAATCTKAVLILATALTLTACASAPVDESQFTRVETKISEAQEMDAKTYAGAEIFAARKKLKAARAADAEGNRKEAAALLEEAELHAELAELRSMTQVQQASLDKINRGLATLKQQLAQ